MNNVVVGDVYDPACIGREAGGDFSLNGDDCTLELFWDHVTNQDVERICSADANFGVWYSEAGDLYFLYRFGDDPWADSVFSLMQIPVEIRQPPRRIGFRQYLTLRVVLVDTETGIVRTRRDIPLSSAFSRKLSGIVWHQCRPDYQNGWTEDVFAERCGVIYEQYPTSAALAGAKGTMFLSTDRKPKHIELNGNADVAAPQARPEPRMERKTAPRATNGRLTSFRRPAGDGAPREARQGQGPRNASRSGERPAHGRPSPNRRTPRYGKIPLSVVYVTHRSDEDRPAPLYSADPD